MKLGVLVMALSLFASVAFAQDDAKRTLFTNVHVFDGVNEGRIANVLVEDNVIVKVSTDPLTNARSALSAKRTLALCLSELPALGH